MLNRDTPQFTMYIYVDILILFSLLTYIMLFDLKYASYTPTLSPHFKTFIDHVYDDLSTLYQNIVGPEKEATQQQTVAMEVDGSDNHTLVEEEKKKRERLAKTGKLLVSAVPKRVVYC